MVFRVQNNQVLVLPTFNGHSCFVYPRQEITVSPPHEKSDDYTIRDLKETEKPGGLAKKISIETKLFIGTPKGRFTVHASQDHRQGLFLRSSDDVRALLSADMLAKGDINKTLAHQQFNALCLAYLAGKTILDIRRRPDAIFPNATPTKRNRALALMNHVGFYKCLKEMRKLVS
jgi:hypothetical protein